MLHSTCTPRPNLAPFVLPTSGAHFRQPRFGRARDWPAAAASSAVAWRRRPTASAFSCAKPSPRPLCKQPPTTSRACSGRSLLPSHQQFNPTKPAQPAAASRKSVQRASFNARLATARVVSLPRLRKLRLRNLAKVSLAPLEHRQRMVSTTLITTLQAPQLRRRLESAPQLVARGDCSRDALISFPVNTSAASRLRLPSSRLCFFAFFAFFASLRLAAQKENTSDAL